MTLIAPTLPIELAQIATIAGVRANFALPPVTEAPISGPIRSAVTVSRAARLGRERFEIDRFEREMIERIQVTDQQSNQETNESWLIKARREASLLQEGLSGFSDAAHEAVSQHKVETAAKVAVSCGVGLGLAYLSRGRSLGPIAARSIGATSSLAFAADIGSNLTQIAGAMTDTARSDANFDHNAQIMRKCMGKFAFDTALMSAAGIGGSAVGHGLFNVRLKDLPPQLVPQMNGRGISQDYYNKLFMVDRHTNVIRNTDGKFAPEKVAKAYQELPGALQKLVSYRQYWTNEFGNYNGPQRLDQTAAMNVLLNGNSQALKLNRISTELAGLHKSNLTNPKIQEQLHTRLQAARGIIYDK